MSLQFNPPPIYNRMLDEQGRVSGEWQKWFNSMHEATRSYLDPNGVYIPQLTTAERDAIPNPDEGLQIYNKDELEGQIRQNAMWRRIVTNPT